MRIKVILSVILLSAAVLFLLRELLDYGPPRPSYDTGNVGLKTGDAVEPGSQAARSENSRGISRGPKAENNKFAAVLDHDELWRSNLRIKRIENYLTLSRRERRRLKEYLAESDPGGQAFVGQLAFEQLLEPETDELELIAEVLGQKRAEDYRQAREDALAVEEQKRKEAQLDYLAERLKLSEKQRTDLALAQSVVEAKEAEFYERIQNTDLPQEQRLSFDSPFDEFKALQRLRLSAMEQALKDTLSAEQMQELKAYFHELPQSPFVDGAGPPEF